MSKVKLRRGWFYLGVVMKIAVDIELNGQLLTVAADYQPEERQTWDSPGCSAEMEVTAVYTEEGSDFTRIIDHPDAWDEINELAMAAWGESCRQSAEDRAVSRYESRMEAKEYDYEWV